jgi:lysophospholipase L1-like esterase
MSRLSKPWLLAALVAAAAAVPYCSPSMASYRIVSGSQLARIFVEPFRGKPNARIWEAVQPEENPPATLVAASPGKGPEQTPAAKPGTTLNAGLNVGLKAGPAEESVPTGPVLEDPANALKTFHEALAKAEAGQGIVRISHFGDSPVTGDLITGEARVRFQNLFGNGGHGWLLPGRPWEWYGHLGVTLEDSGWHINTPVTNGRHDHFYGFGGASFASNGGATSKVTPGKGSPFSQLEIHYLAQPKGGSLQVKVDGEVSEVSTRRAEAGPALQVLTLTEDKPHTVTLRAQGDGEVVLYGLVMEHGTHGVVYDALGANGGAIHHLTLMNEENWITALKLRRPDLVILAYGTNESGYVNIPGPGYDKDYREIVRRIRKALPGVSILIMAPMDRAERTATGEIGTMPSIPKIVAAQRKLALELGCAFFNTYEAMGGEGTALRWYQANPHLMTGDFTHPTRTGADRVARLLVEALRQQHDGWKSGQAAPSANSKLEGAEGKASPESSKNP